MTKFIFLLFLAGCATTEPKSEPGEIKCRGTKMIGWANPSELTEMDKLTFVNAKAHCFITYPTELPCLVSVKKTMTSSGHYHYHAICGEPMHE